MKYRVLVVDDSPVIRRLVRQALESDPEIEVSGAAANGNVALAMMAQQTSTQQGPDAIVLDLEMPEMDGLETLRALRARGLETPVVIFSTPTERGVLATLDALAAGADDYVTMPADAGNTQEILLRIGLQVIPRIKALCWKSRRTAHGIALRPSHGQPGAIHSALEASPTPVSAASKVPPAASRIDIVAIGTSTGGPSALAEVLARMPARFPVPLVIVQHMPPTFTRFLAERLTAASPLLVREAVSGARLEPGHAWIAPGDFHMELRREESSIRLQIFQAEPENSCRPSVDVLFRSVAQLFQQNALAVVMTGMGHDGLRGCECIAQARGQVIVQDEASSVVWGMPGYVARAGLANCVLPLNEIADEIVRRVSRGRHTLTGASPAVGAVKPARLDPAKGGPHGA